MPHEHPISGQWHPASPGRCGDFLDDVSDHLSLAPFQIPQMERVTGVSGLSAASPAGMGTRNEHGLVAMRALRQNLGPVTVQTAQVSLLGGVDARTRRSF